MRKGLLIAFGILMAFALVTPCFAEQVADVIYSVNIRNNTGELLDTLIPVTTIRPEVDKLTGYDVMTLAPTGANTETWISIFDSTDSLLTGECFGEQEGTGGPESIGDRWPRGKRIFNGIAIRQGAYTDVQIYFRRK